MIALMTVAGLLIGLLIDALGGGASGPHQGAIAAYLVSFFFGGRGAVLEAGHDLLHGRPTALVRSSHGPGRNDWLWDATEHEQQHTLPKSEQWFAAGCLYSLDG